VKTSFNSSDDDDEDKIVYFTVRRKSRNLV